MLNAGGQVYQSKVKPLNPPFTLANNAQGVSNEAQPGQTTSSPYFQQMSSTLNPRDIQPQYNMQMQRPQGLQVNAHQTNGMLSQQAQQSILQFQPQSTAALVAKATKEPKAKARKGSGKGGSASDSDDDLDIEDEPPEAKPAMLSILKPTEQPGKLLWEVVDAVWSPRNKPASADKIRTAVASVGEAVRNVRDQWKAQNEQLKKAELPAAPTALQVPALKAAVGTHRETMERLVVKVAQFGHPWILKRYVSFFPAPLIKCCNFVPEQLQTYFEQQHTNRKAFMTVLMLFLHQTRHITAYCHALAFMMPTTRPARLMVTLDSSMSCNASVLHTTLSA